jgi:hypothetical protein
MAIKDKRESRSSDAEKLKIKIIKINVDARWTEDRCGLTH